MTSTMTSNMNAPHFSKLRRMIPNEPTGTSFPALHLVRSSWLARWLARCTFVLLIVAVVALVFVPWQQSSRGQGRVVARDPQKRPQTVTASNDGIIEWIEPGFQEGSLVSAGEIVMRLAPFAPEEINQVKAQLVQVQTKKIAIEQAIAIATENVTRQKLSGEAEVRSELSGIEAARAKWEQEKASVEELRAEYSAKLFKLQGVEQLFPVGLKSELDVREAFAEEQSAKKKVENAEQKVEEQFQLLNGKEESLQAKREAVDIKNNESKNKLQSELQKVTEVEKEIQELGVKLGQLGRLEVSSPRAGIVQSLQINSGSDTVKKGDSLFIVVPDTSELAVELTVAGNDSPLIHIGDEVRLQFQGWPAIQWVGWPSIAVGTFGGRVNSINPSDDGNGNFMVFVTPDTEDNTQVPWPDNRYLRQGVRSNGWVLLRTVPLGYEIWRQLNGFPPIIQDPKRDSASSTKDAIKKPKLPK
ncbi:MAG: HlyD family efflux transporter periplasmic adaptor subunit [Pirellulaceae bacterium]|nr:HlyD family efflux transporter periplasmic adaptor subunit [Pirellulaceae bacterium]